MALVNLKYLHSIVFSSRQALAHLSSVIPSFFRISDASTNSAPGTVKEQGQLKKTSAELHAP